METDDSHSHPSPDEAQRALEAATHEENATRYPPLSSGFFVIQAVALGAIPASQALPTPLSTVIAALGLATAIIVGVRSVFYRPGFGFMAPDAVGSFPFLLVVLVVVVVPAVLAIGFEEGWMWLLSGALVAGVTLEMGRRYRKATARG